ncbi:MAG: glucose-6-phosphate 1-dehydrogenase [Rhodospirillaceae bacterium]|jgi:glucose-6-phosphate 1-dehydrogenase|nr:glucose-6-phosphate 1-dehydrogenase [Rhodospirillaceae bacterium]
MQYSRPTLISDPFDMVVFGGRGDLARRKLLPALYHLDREDRLPPDGRIIAVSRGEMAVDDYRGLMRAACAEFTPGDGFSDAAWGRFAGRLQYVQLDAAHANSYGALSDVLTGRESVARVFYLATAPDLFGPISVNLGQAGLVSGASRVVLEKPLGHDLASAQAINAAVAAAFGEPQIYRIDHYLGKETVQNLMVLRFANALFEPLWNRTFIDHVEISVAETVGVGGRWRYYNEAGALRDMVQNHMLQLLCLTAMEPPGALDADAIRDEKLKVLRALRPIHGGEGAQLTVRGQYRAGAIDGKLVSGYLDEPDANSGSNTETFVAIKAGIDNWRWAGVPFYLRTGKRLPSRASEIVVQFKSPPHVLYPETAGIIQPNKLVMRLQPDEGIRLLMLNKQRGPGELKLRQTALDLSFNETFGGRSPDAYERLLLDVIRGRQALFMRVDEVEAAWRWIDGIVNSWGRVGLVPKPYGAGTWGPSAAVALIERDGRTWHEDEP